MQFILYIQGVLEVVDEKELKYTNKQVSWNSIMLDFSEWPIG